MKLQINVENTSTLLRSLKLLKSSEYDSIDTADYSYSDDSPSTSFIMKTIAQALITTPSTITSIKIGQINKEDSITSDDIVEFFQILKTAESKSLDQLTSLEFSDNEEITDIGLRALIDGVKMNQLKDLNLRGANIGNEGVALLAQALKGAALTDLNLSDNNIDDGGAGALNIILEANNLKTLDISDNKIGNQGVALLAEALIGAALTCLNLSDNNIDDGGVGALNIILKANNLKTLDISHNKIGDNGMENLYTALKENTELVNFSIGYNEVTDFLPLAEHLADKDNGVSKINLDSKISDSDNLNPNRFEVIKKLFESKSLVNIEFSFNDWLQNKLVIQALEDNYIITTINHFGPYSPHVQPGFFRDEAELRQVISAINRNRDIFKKAFQKFMTGSKEVTEKMLPFIQTKFPLIREPLPLIGEQLPLIEKQISLIRQDLSLRENQLPLIGEQLLSMKEQLPSLEKAKVAVKTILDSFRKTISLTEQELRSLYYNFRLDGDESNLFSQDAKTLYLKKITSCNNIGMYTKKYSLDPLITQKIIDYLDPKSQLSFYDILKQYHINNMIDDICTRINNIPTKINQLLAQADELLTYPIAEEFNEEKRDTAQQKRPHDSLEDEPLELRSSFSNTEGNPSKKAKLQDVLSATSSFPDTEDLVSKSDDPSAKGGGYNDLLCIDASIYAPHYHVAFEKLGTNLQHIITEVNHDAIYSVKYIMENIYSKNDNSDGFKMPLMIEDKSHIKPQSNEKISINFNDLLYKSTISFKGLDFMLDTFRFINEPSVESAEKTLRDVVHLQSAFGGNNMHSMALSFLDITNQLYKGEIQGAGIQAITSISYMALPTMLTYTGIPYLGLAYGSLMAGYSGYHAVSNAYSLYLEYGTVEWQLKSAVAYKGLYEVLANSPLQQYTYDFASNAKWYEVQANSINLEIEKTQIKQQLEAKGEFGDKLYDYIYAPILEEKYNLLSKIISGELTEEQAQGLKAKHISITIGEQNYEHCMEVKNDVTVITNEQYYCYNEEPQMLDHIAIIGGNFIEVIESL